MLILYIYVLVRLKRSGNPCYNNKVNQMNSRVKVFGIIAILGFLAGIIAQVTATVIIPYLAEVLPLLGGTTNYIISGFAGAILTVALVSVWAYMTGKKEPY